MCAAIIVWIKAVGQRRQTEEEIAGFHVQIWGLCVCWGWEKWPQRRGESEAGNLLDNDMGTRKGFGRTAKGNV